MTTKQIGNITEVAVMLAFLQQGYNVLTPYGNCERYDFVVDINNRFYKIQVKTASDQNGKIVIPTSSTNYSGGKWIRNKYTDEEIDFFATTYNNQAYLIPIVDCGGREISLRYEPTKNGQISGIKWLKDYKLEEVVNKL